jgi:hypothetical protein
MAAFFVFEDNAPVRLSCGSSKRDEHPGLEWHVGKPIPVPQTRYGMTTPPIIEVQADGDELKLIRELFVNLPDVRATVVRWFGDTAKFIYHNLPRG